jgi:hypothetical protein
MHKPVTKLAFLVHSWSQIGQFDYFITKTSQRGPCEGSEQSTDDMWCCNVGKKQPMYSLHFKI